MDFKNLHPFNVTLEEAYKIQIKLKNKLLIGEKYFKKLKYIASCDVAYSKIDNLGYAVVVVYKFPETSASPQSLSRSSLPNPHGSIYDQSMEKQKLNNKQCTFLNGQELELLEEKYAVCKITFPYIPGYLAFREGPCILKAFRKIKTQPDLIVFDGHGIAHPQYMGLASHLGIILNVSTIGCAKSSLNLHYRIPPNKIGAYSLVFQNREVVALVLRSKKSVKPIFISPGHKINLDISYRIIMRLLDKYKIPSILRNAHIQAQKLRQEYENNE